MSDDPLVIWLSQRTGQTHDEVLADLHQRWFMPQERRPIVRREPTLRGRVLVGARRKWRAFKRAAQEARFRVGLAWEVLRGRHDCYEW